MQIHLDREALRPTMLVLGLTLVTLALASCRDYGPTVCDPSEMPAPILGSPGGEADPIPGTYDLSLTPTFNWIYTGECLPDRYQILISIYPSAVYPTVLEEVTPIIGPTIIGEGGVAGHAFAWTLTEALEPGSAYYWRVKPRSGIAVGERSEWGAFLTPPLCAGVGVTLAQPQPAFPGNGTTVPSSHPEFMWDDPTPCALIGGNYTLQVSTSPTFTPDTTLTQRAGDYTHYDGYLGLSYCTHYYWRVRFASVEATIPPGPYSDVWHFYTPEIPEIGGCSIPTPAAAAAEAPPDISAAAPELMAREDSSCRLGPSTLFNIAAYLVQGQVVPITGRLSEGGWWQVQPPDIQVPCWIAADIAEPYGDLTQVPIAIAPALPTEEPTEEPPSGCWCWTAQQCCAHFDACPAACTPCPSAAPICP